jgi:hypothetical protein
VRALASDTFAEARAALIAMDLPQNIAGITVIVPRAV